MAAKLPPEHQDRVVDVSLRHVVAGFLVFVTAIAALSALIILLKDFSKARRQRSAIDAVTQLILTIKQIEKGELCKDTSSKNRRRKEE